MNQTNRLPLKRTFARFYLRLAFLPLPPPPSPGWRWLRFSIIPHLYRNSLPPNDTLSIWSATGSVIFRPIILRMHLKGAQVSRETVSGTSRELSIFVIMALLHTLESVYAFELGLGAGIVISPLCRSSPSPSSLSFIQRVIFWPGSIQF